MYTEKNTHPVCEFCRRIYYYCNVITNDYRHAILLQKPIAIVFVAFVWYGLISMHGSTANNNIVSKTKYRVTYATNLLHFNCRIGPLLLVCIQELLTRRYTKSDLFPKNILKLAFFSNPGARRQSTIHKSITFHFYFDAKISFEFKNALRVMG